MTFATNKLGVLPTCTATPTAFGGGPGTIMSCARRLPGPSLLQCGAGVRAAAACTCPLQNAR